MIEKENRLNGYFCIVTSERMTAKEVIRAGDGSEKPFLGDKPCLGDWSLRIYSGLAAELKIFIAFIALIIRNLIYTLLKGGDEEAG